MKHNTSSVGLFWPLSGLSLASNGPVVDRRYLTLVFGPTEATHNKLFLSRPTKYTLEPSWMLVLVRPPFELLLRALTTIVFAQYCLDRAPKSFDKEFGKRVSRKVRRSGASEDSLFHTDSSLKTIRDVKIHALKLRLLACRRSSNCNDLLPNMKTQRSAMSLKRLLPDTGLRVLRTQVPE
ncbi:hypothetical protein TNCV_1139411 [Trichonephila clavipes]|nr:hypothetical protein TNCV_1139411 [Trichonephila clavipes]